MQKINASTKNDLEVSIGFDCLPRFCTIQHIYEKNVRGKDWRMPRHKRLPLLALHVLSAIALVKNYKQIRTGCKEHT